MKPQAVLFDWDVTVVDSAGSIHAALDDVFECYGGERWSPADVADWLRRSMRVSFKDLFGANAKDAATYFYTCYRDHHLENVSLMPGALDTLTMLRDAGLYLGVVSSKRGTLVRAEAQVLDIGEFFSSLVGAADAEQDKPHAAAIELALQGSGRAIAGKDVWYVGDCGIDVVCARNSGCTAVIIGPSPALIGDESQDPDHHFVDHLAFQTFVRENKFTI